MPMTSAPTAQLLIFAVIGVDQMMRIAWITMTTRVTSIALPGLNSMPNSGSSAAWLSP